MDISIPDTVEFYIHPVEGNDWMWVHLCFMHAVKRAINGEQIETKLVEYTTSCDDCEAVRRG